MIVNDCQCDFNIFKKNFIPTKIKLTLLLYYT